MAILLKLQAPAGIKGSKSAWLMATCSRWELDLINIILEEERGPEMKAGARTLVSDLVLSMRRRHHIYILVRLQRA